MCRVDLAAAKAVVWSECKMGRNNESGMLFGATVNAERQVAMFHVSPAQCFHNKPLKVTSYGTSLSASLPDDKETGCMSWNISPHCYVLSCSAIP